MCSERNGKVDEGDRRRRRQRRWGPAGARAAATVAFAFQDLHRSHSHRHSQRYWPIPARSRPHPLPPRRRAVLRRGGRCRFRWGGGWRRAVRRRGILRVRVPPQCPGQRPPRPRHGQAGDAEGDQGRRRCPRFGGWRKGRLRPEGGACPLPHRRRPQEGRRRAARPFSKDGRRRGSGRQEVARRDGGGTRSALWPSQ